MSIIQKKQIKSQNNGSLNKINVDDLLENNKNEV